MNDQPDDVCLCLTPLHTLTLRQIAEHRGIPFARGLYLTSTDGPKHRYYADSMRSFCRQANYLVVSEESYGGIKHWNIWRRRIRQRHLFRKFGPADTVFVPSSLNDDVYAFLSAFHFRTLNSFDDGILNVERGSCLWRSRTTPTARLFLLAAGIRYWPERIRAESARHYTLYNVANICPKTQLLNLVPTLETPLSASTKTVTVKILLGSAPEAGPEVHAALEAAAAKLKPDYYVPHPRERDTAFNGVRPLESPLVIEDYIVTQLRSEPSYAFELYGCDSSALVNLAQTHRVKTFALPTGTDCQSSGMRELMAAAGVELLPVL